MDLLVNVFTFRPLVPLYLLLAGWLLVWLLAFLVSRLLLGSKKNGWADLAAYEAWAIAIGLHLLAAVSVTAWLSYDAFTTGAWLSPDSRLYLLAYGVVVAIGLVFSVSLGQQRRAAQAAIA